MPDAEFDTSTLPGANSAANVSQTGGQVLTGYVDAQGGGNADTAFIQGEVNYEGTPLFQTGIDTTVLQGQVDNTDSTPLQGQVDKTGPAPAPSTPIDARQVVKVDIRNTVVQPLEPCLSSPYLQLTFRPTDPTAKFERSLQRQTSIPFPKPQQITETEFKAQFDGKCHLADMKYLLRWKLVLPVIIQPQDPDSVSYTSVVVYDLRTAFLVNDPTMIDKINFSQIPLTQVSEAHDTTGGTTSDDFQDYELELDQIVFVDVEQSTGRLIGKNPVDAGIFTGA